MPTYETAIEIKRAMLGLGWQELLIVFSLVLVIFGAGKLPAVGRNLGEGIKNFKKGIKDEEKQEDKAKLTLDESATATIEKDAEKESSPKDS